MSLVVEILHSQRNQESGLGSSSPPQSTRRPLEPKADPPRSVILELKVQPSPGLHLNP
jgi:hypothetical protein